MMLYFQIHICRIEHLAFASQCYTTAYIQWTLIPNNSLFAYGAVKKNYHSSFIDLFCCFCGHTLLHLT